MVSQMAKVIPLNNPSSRASDLENKRKLNVKWPEDLVMGYTRVIG